MMTIDCDHMTRPAATCAMPTLGCTVNQAASVAKTAALRVPGLRPAVDQQPASVVAAYRCSVILRAARTTCQPANQACRRVSAALAVAMGCYAPVASAGFTAVPGIDRSVLNTAKDDSAATSRDHRARGTQMKVPGGCDHRRTDCIVPTTYGAVRSRVINESDDLVRRKTTADIQEVVLTGVHLRDYYPASDSDLLACAAN